MAEAKKIVVANWKMKLDLKQSLTLASALKSLKIPGREVVVCPAFVHLLPVGEILKNSAVSLGAQDAFWETAGAFTGEVSPAQLREIGCQYVIVGHSERRQNLGETDEMVHKKIKAVVAAGLTPILCVGETLAERRQGGQNYVLISQVTKALEGISLNEQQVVVAYEPVWVIGSGQAIAPEQAALAHQVIRQTLIDLFPAALIKSNFRIIYGGSIEPDNVAAFTRLEHTAGVLVGGASLALEEFVAIINNV